MTVIHRREKVVLCLHVKAASEDVHEVAISCDVVRGEDLMLEEVLIKFLMSVWSEMVDLGGDHEEE